MVTFHFQPVGLPTIRSVEIAVPYRVPVPPVGAVISPPETDPDETYYVRHVSYDYTDLHRGNTTIRLVYGEQPPFDHTTYPR